MKTDILRLQGQDIVVTAAAKDVIVHYLKELELATWLRGSTYKQYVEALRDVLTAKPVKSVSRTAALRAVQVVGLPSADEAETGVMQAVAAWFSRLGHGRLVTRLKRRATSAATKRALRVVFLALSVALLFLGTMAIFSTFVSLTLVPTTQQSGWIVATTSIGPVRSWQDAHSAAQQVSWPFGWAGSAALGVLCYVAAFGFFGLARRGVRAWRVAVVLISGFFILGLMSLQRLNTPIPLESQILTDQTPVQPKLAYLQQCGDEIPYVFDGNSSGMLFRSLRDEGYTLATPIKTMESNGTMNIEELCQRYDALRQTHAKKDIVLQFYTVQADGTLRPYDFSDIENSDVTSTFGLFVKS